MKIKKMPPDLKSQTLRDKNAMIFATVCIMIFMSVSAVLIYIDSHENTKEYALENVQESLLQSKSKLELISSQGVDTLTAISQIMADTQITEGKDAAKILASGKDGTIFESLGIRYRDGKTLTDQNVLISSAEWGQEVLFDNTKTEATVAALTTSMPQGKQIVRIFVPIEIKGIIIAHVYGVVDEDKLAQYFSQTRYGSSCDVIVFESKSGNVIMKTGSNLDLSGSKIGVLGTHGEESKRIFKDIIKNKSGYTNITSQKGGVVCVYAPVGIGDWYMMYAVSQETLARDFQKNNYNLIYVSLISLLLMFVLAVYAYTKTKHARNVTDSIIYEVNLRDKIFSSAFSETSIRVFLYNKSDNKITVLKDAEGIYKRKTTLDEGMNYISEYEKLDANDTRRMRNIMALTGTDGSIKLTVRSHRTNPPAMLKYAFSGIKTVFGDDNVIICTASEVSDVKRQKTDVENFSNAVASYKTTCLELFLESNRYRCVWNNEPIMDAKLQTNVLESNYDNDLKRKILPEIKSHDRQTFGKNMNRLNLLEYFRSGKTEFSFDCRIKTTKPFPDDYELRIIDVYLLRDKKTDEVKANVYIRNVDITTSDKM